MLRYTPKSAAKLVVLIQNIVDSRLPHCSLDGFLLTCLREMSKAISSDSKYLPWSDLPLVPSSDELLISPEEDFANLRPVKLNHAYECCEDYFDTYFCLLRADCFSSLRASMRALLAGNLDYRDMNVYTKVNIAGISITTHGLIIGLKITPQKMIKNWSVCTNLMYGNLLCISPSGSFTDVIWAVVADRDVKELQKNSIIFVELCTENNQRSDVEVISSMLSVGSALMVESPTYYHANKPVLCALQEFDLTRMPFEEELVQGKPVQIPPEYLRCIDVNNLLQSSGEKLDRFQFEALTKVFSQRLVCIQGPPGTGKTFLGVEVVRDILAFPERPESPILVITYKNHALDEFLMKILQYYPGEVARIGGRSKEEMLEKCNLHTLATGWKPDHIHKPLKEIQAVITETREKLKTFWTELMGARYLTLSTLIRYLTVPQKKSLLTNACGDCEKTIRKLINELESGTAHTQLSDAGKSLIKGFRNWCPSKSVCEAVLFATKVKSGEDGKQRIYIENDLQNAYYDVEDIEKMENERLILPSKTMNSSLLRVIKPKQILADFSLQNHSKEYISQLPFVQLGITEDLFSIDYADRTSVLQCILVMQETDVKERFASCLKQYQDLCRERTAILDMHKSELLSSKKVIGMTVTGANLYRGLLNNIKPAVVLVEEAAEVSEAHLMPLLNEWVQHLILIGDHKQLRPQVETYRLVTEFNFDISMMERLIENGIGYSTLNKQSRMHPDISKFLLDIYPDLEDNNSIVDRLGQISCAAERVFFWDHRDTEKEERSYSNIKEADRAINLAFFFIQQGITPQQITILAPYQGQVRILREKLKTAKAKLSGIFTACHEQSAEANKEEAPRIQIQTIDQYQGDENDVVIVSLTRSNERKKVGFLKILNRRCVAQSRSRRGLYYIGNSETLSANQHWEILLKALRKAGKVDDRITLVCPRHPKSTKCAKIAKDIPLTEVFCHKRCGKPLPCKKHRCDKCCQPPHSHVTCSQQCVSLCPNGHTYTEKCNANHSHQCNEIVEFVHKRCGHRDNKKCFEDADSVICNTPVHFQFASCGHIGEKKCSESTLGKKCQEPCSKLLKCNHVCNMKCGEPCNHGSCDTCEQIQIKLKEQRHKEEEEKRKMAKKEATYMLMMLQKRSDPIEYRKLLPNDENCEYKEIENMLKCSLPSNAKGEVSVRNVFKVYNPNTSKHWYESISQMFDPMIKAKRFLQWDSQHDLSQEQNELKIKITKGDYGNGIYLSSKLESCHLNAGISDVRSCLVVDALIGKAITVKHGTKRASRLLLTDLRKRGYDSIEETSVPLENGLTTEISVLLSPDHILPLYKIDYQVMILDQLGEVEANAIRERRDEVVKHVLLPKREYQGSDPFDVQFQVVEATFLRLLQSIPNNNLFKKKGLENNKYKIVSVDYWINPNLLRQFLVKMDELRRTRGPGFDKYVLAFHGTKKTTESIFRNNFDINQSGSGSGDQGYYGKGFYFSEFPQTSRYYGENLLLCRILPGKTFPINHDDIQEGRSLEDGFDSHTINIQNEGYSEEIVIFDPRQILPLYEIKCCKVP
ncbi:hypothetical protein LSH36_449g01010 [Paralvinella palmiformis]|uniref:PARP n=1 Tax=Paralvinella palmiformis TaxID=53620 RepID=A0AAD9JAG2_9ANNE|nr:hypothetical protein LSH36_449g01010 [Paralvinella palmiformis]